MTALRTQLAEQLARFDDEAYAALANRGLLRRAQKDLGTQSAQITQESPEHLTVAFGGQHIRFDARGPAFAQCTCPASGVCQHILAAAIGLQRLGTSGAATAQTMPASVEGEAEPPLAGLHASLMALDAAELSRHAGKAGYRWAWQFIQDLDPEQAAQIGGERYLVIGFRHPRINFRYMGGGMDGLIGDIQISQIEKYRVAAVLAYQRAYGSEPAPPEAAGKARTAALDLGKDHVLPVSEQTLLASRERLRASASRLLQESIELGLSHLSQGIHERYSTLAVWAQGAEYYRLALLLRRMADHVEMLLERAGGADEHRLLDEIALAYGLVDALEQSARRGATPSQLMGRARSRYEQAGSLELVGLGAHAWRSGSGYVGLTMLFWSVADRKFISCTDARPELQRGFNPIARYKAAGPWSGLGAPALATGRRLMLSGAQLNAQGRLSAAESTSAIVQGWVDAGTLADMLQPVASWAALLQARSLHRRSLLAELDPMKDWAVLLPAHFGAASFDPARQVMVWPAFDAREQVLNLELIYSDYTQHAIARIEQMASGVPQGTLVVARLHNTPTGMVAEPISLIRSVSEGSAVDALHFEETLVQSYVSKWLSRLRRDGEGLEKQHSFAASVIPPPLRELRHWLQRQAERGVAGEVADRARAELLQHSGRAAAAGLSACARGLQEGLPVAAAILRSRYICMQYERLLADDPEDAA